jgi:gluconolactonase
MALDSAERLYVAAAAGIQVVDPRDHHLGTIRVPLLVRNLAFGGAGRRTLYMTAAQSLFRVPMLSEGPPDRGNRAGSRW